jgi:hypothetical protein
MRRSPEQDAMTRVTALLRAFDHFTLMTTNPPAVLTDPPRMRRG